MHTKIWWSYVHIRYLVHVQKWTYLALGWPYGWALNFKVILLNGNMNVSQSFLWFVCRRLDAVHVVTRPLSITDILHFLNFFFNSTTRDKLTIVTFLPWHIWHLCTGVWHLWTWVVLAAIFFLWQEVDGCLFFSCDIEWTAGVFFSPSQAANFCWSVSGVERCGVTVYNRSQSHCCDCCHCSPLSDTNCDKLGGGVAISWRGSLSQWHTAVHLRSIIHHSFIHSLRAWSRSVRLMGDLPWPVIWLNKGGLPLSSQMTSKLTSRTAAHTSAALVKLYKQLAAGHLAYGRLIYWWSLPTGHLAGKFNQSG